ncbi:hypothetical protein FT643_03290 [Ketobacter sp. MCCC 1A13808]|uniref:hypothetical protein n=1 Tax=Ketobacter sp. MCCC 1A13808 TaxID=2602738 RepID=UPI0012EC3740|nr:hypothetical protein [Ketobacter sp. MCCC 1A13808]MVF11161.1 hypothetical protein [Ketobacter sp. MCCC 1A13808]
MGSLKVDTALLKELLSAAAGTALMHRGTEHELFVLGQLEATANMAYVACANAGDDELEILCQQLALDALNRFTELSQRSGSKRTNEIAEATNYIPYQAVKAS